MDTECLASIHSKAWLIYIKSISPLFLPVSKNILREVCKYISDPHILPCFNGSTFLLYDLETRQYYYHKLSVRIEADSVYCLWLEKWVLIATATHKVFKMNINDQSVHQAPPMATARYHPGIIALRSCVYIFGGNYSPTLTSGEGLHIPTEQWCCLPDMTTARVAFTPCVYRKEIYLCTANSNWEVFTPLSWSLHCVNVFFRSYGQGTVAFSDNDSIYVISERILFTWKVGSREINTKALESSRSEAAISRVAPVWFERCVYWANSVSGSIVECDMERWCVT